MKTVTIAICMVGILLAPCPAGRARAQTPEEPTSLSLYIGLMERLLEVAVQHGASKLNKHIPPGYELLLFGDAPRAQGFILDGYGVFFNVNVPTLRGSLLWTMRTLDQNQLVGEPLENMRKSLGKVRDAKTKKELEDVLAQIQAVVAPVDRSGDATQQGKVDTKAQGKGTVVAQGTVDAAPAEQGQPKAAVVDPLDVYRLEVRNALTETILDFGHSAMKHLQANEWLIVAARGSDAQTPFGSPSGEQRLTWLLKVSGRDLAAVRQGTMTREQLRLAIQIKEY